MNLSVVLIQVGWYFHLYIINNCRSKFVPLNDTSDRVQVLHIEIKFIISDALTDIRINEAKRFVNPGVDFVNLFSVRLSLLQSKLTVCNRISMSKQGRPIVFNYRSILRMESRVEVKSQNHM